MKYYDPQTKHEKKLFPNLGLAEIIGGIPEYIGKKGVIIQEDDEVARIVFPHFWHRPDGMNAVEAQDNTWCFSGEYKRIDASEVMTKKKYLVGVDDTTFDISDEMFETFEEATKYADKLLIEENFTVEDIVIFEITEAYVPSNPKYSWEIKKT